MRLMATRSRSVRFLPLPRPWFVAAAVLLAVLLLTIEIRIIEYVYGRIGIPPRHMVALLALTLIGSRFNIPLWRVRSGGIVQDAQATAFGLRWVIPAGRPTDETLIAVNVGGALIPILLSLRILAVTDVVREAAIVTSIVTTVTWWLARPVRGVGIVMPTFVAPVTAAVAATFLAPAAAPAVAYVGGTLGTLLGADVLNLGRIRGIGAPMASIGGAGTFDGIFLTGVLAVLLA